MTHLWKKHLAPVLAVCLSILLFASCQPPASSPSGAGALESKPEASAQTLTIIHTNDVHSHVEVEPYVKALAKQYRAEGKEVFLISAGDAFAGTPFASLSGGEDVAKVMNDVGYDLFLLGNHEQMGGPELITTVTTLLDCPVLGSNLPPTLLEAGKDVQDYFIQDFFGTKVAFLGVTTIISPEEGTVSGDLLVEHMEAIKAKAEKEGATVFVGVSHLGVTDVDETNRSTYVADKCPWLTAMIDAHCHTVHEKGLEQNGVLIAETGEYGSNIGVVELVIENGEVISKSAKVIAIAGQEETCGIVPDEALAKMITEKQAENDVFLQTVLTQIPEDLDGERESARTKQTNFGNLLADAALWKTGADFAVVHSPFIRGSLQKGDFTNEMFLTVFLNPRELFTSEVTGQEILDMLESGLQAYPEVSPTFLQIGGAEVVFNPKAEPFSRVVSVTMKDGKPLDPAKTYLYTSGQAKLVLGEDAVEGVDYQEGFGTFNQAFVDYLNSGETLDTQPDKRIAPAK